jgi:hypothetical protein
VELGVVLFGDVVLALPLGEGDQGDLFRRRSMANVGLHGLGEVSMDDQAA